MLKKIKQQTPDPDSCLLFHFLSLPYSLYALSFYHVPFKDHYSLAVALAAHFADEVVDCVAAHLVGVDAMGCDLDIAHSREDVVIITNSRDVVGYFIALLCSCLC